MLRARSAVFALLAAALTAQAPPPGTQPPSGAQAPPSTSGEPTIAAADLLAHLEFLASDAMKGRMTGSEEAAKAAEYIAEHMERHGLKPAGAEKGSYFMPFSGMTRKCRNVCGLLPGSDAALRREMVVIGAHYDHVGNGAIGSRGRRGEIHNGADDNASGTSALLELIQAFAGAPPKRSLLFLAFSGEELGLVGSTAFCDKPTVPIKSLVAMVNLDMVGRSRSGFLFVGGINTAKELREIVPAANEGIGLDLELNGGGLGPSDFQPFYQAQVPVLFFTTGEHAEYHTQDDDVPLIDVAAEEKVARLAFRVARTLADGRRLKWQADERTAMPLSSVRGTDQAKAFLGLELAETAVPDEGLAIVDIKRIKGVGNEPLLEGDGVLEVDGIEAESRTAVNRHLAIVPFGEKVKLKVRRDRKVRTLNLVMTFSR